MALTDAKTRAAKPDEKPYKLADSGNIFLLVHPNGSKYWGVRKVLPRVYSVVWNISGLRARGRCLRSRICTG